jgi:hypothetical protein
MSCSVSCRRGSMMNTLIMPWSAAFRFRRHRPRIMPAHLRLCSPACRWLRSSRSAPGSHSHSAAFLNRAEATPQNALARRL